MSSEIHSAEQLSLLDPEEDVIDHCPRAEPVVAPLTHRPDGVCEGPRCTRPVKGGLVPISTKRYFCSTECQNKLNNHRYEVGTCEFCGGAIYGSHRGLSETARFCNREHYYAFVQNENLGPTGPFRTLLEEYMEVCGYAKSTKSGLKASLARFYTHAYAVEKNQIVEDIVSPGITRFLVSERERGMQSANVVGALSSMFEWMIDEGRYSRSNPITKRHRAFVPPPQGRYPYEENEMSLLRGTTDASGFVRLKLIFALGEECGLRNSEVCNIRLSDVNMTKQEIFVRLPTKNKQTRMVPYHNKVKKLLTEWLNERDASVPCDHLLYNKHRRPMQKDTLDNWFRELYVNHPEPAASFIFHRLRHTWATRLLNADMELTVLKELGGWKSLSSVEWYAKLNRSTKERQYKNACLKMEQTAANPVEQSLSLLDLARKDTPAARNREYSA